MLWYQIRYFSESQLSTIELPLNAATLGQALAQVHRFDLADVSPKFGVSLWTYGVGEAWRAHSVSELTIKNGQGSLPKLPVTGNWRKQIGRLLCNLDPQYEGTYLRALHSAIFGQVMGLLTMSKAISPELASTMAKVHRDLDSALSIHKSVRGLDRIEFNQESKIDSLLRQLNNLCPGVPEEFEFDSGMPSGSIY